MNPEIKIPVPAPGEPFRHEVHPENQRVLELEQQKRAEKLRGRLTKGELRKIRWRMRIIRWWLSLVGYNKILHRRNAVHAQYTALGQKIRQNPNAKLIKQFKTLGAMGRDINRRLAGFSGMIDEYRSLQGKIKIHNAVLEWERKDKADYDEFVKEARNWEQLILSVFRQSARLHHRYEDKNGKTKVDIPKIRRIFIKDDKVLYMLDTASQNAIQRWLGVWSNRLPYNVDIAALVSDETLENLSTACNRRVTVERSSRGTNIYYAISRMDSPDSIPKTVLYAKIPEYYPTKDHPKTPWCAGMTEDRRLEWFNFEDYPHMLIAGTTLSGKSNHINQMIATMVSMNTPDELRLVLIDNKGGVEFTHWQDLKHLLMPMVKHAEGVNEALGSIREMMTKRLEAFERVKAKKLMSYNQKMKQKLPRIVVFIDEMATLLDLGKLTQEIHTQLRVISSQGRAVGIHLVLCTQHPSIDVLPNTIKTNMFLRVSGKMPSVAASMVVLDSISAAELPDLPGRLIFSVGRYEKTAQSPFITDEEVARAVEISTEYDVPNNTELESALETESDEFGESDVIEIALARMDGQLSADKMLQFVSEKITRFGLRRLVDSITKRQKIEHNGVEYMIKRVRQAYYLKPIHTSIHSENDHESISA